MRVENVNSFVQGAQSTLLTISGESGKLGKLFVKNPPYIGKEVSVKIGIVGDLKGEVIYTMDENCGLFLASRFMMSMGFEINEFNDMAKEAVKELANMISGNAANALFSQGVKVDITTPTYANKGEASGFVTPGSTLLCMPIHFEGEQVFEVDLHLHE
ncbi:MAG: chemotaxis protein CheX [Defluviitaleaceae bacterium]|nr:chemotaxis protein CheX [Defluviitaleaceae bacterium]